MSQFLARWAKLYSDPTPAERALEPVVASLGVRYRFQHPLWALGVFPDFVLLDDRVVIEVDDPSHFTAKGRTRDEERTKKLTNAGWTVVRCTNAEALSDPGAALTRMLIEAGLPYRPHRNDTKLPAAAPTTTEQIRAGSPASERSGKSTSSDVNTADPEIAPASSGARSKSRAATARTYRAHKKSPAKATTNNKAITP